MNSITQREVRALADQAKSIIDQARAEGRERTPAEERRVAEFHARINETRARDEQIMNEVRGESIEQIGVEPFGAKSLGEAFVASDGYKRIKSATTRPQTWSSGPVEMSTKGTLFEGATGGTLVPPYYRPGIVSQLFQPVGLSDYFASETTTSSHVRYVVEGTATSGAAGVAEGGDKPQSTFAYSEVDEQVKKIATSLPISDELLEDAVSVQSYINGRLNLFVRMEEERQLLLGVGGNELGGVIGRSGVNTWARGTVDNNAVAIFKAAAGSRGSAFVDPDLVVMNPANWQTTRLLTDSAGQFFGGGPWQGSYGQQSQVSTGQFSSSPLWGMNVWVTNAIGAGTALLGSFKQAAAIYRRGGPRVEATNSHSDFFVKDLAMVRAEQREALAVYRPASFVVISGLN